MRDFLLLTAVAAVVGFGFFLMKNLDRFLENNHPAQTGRCSPGKTSLQIGLSNPLAVEGLSDALAQYSKNQPIRLYCGTEEELNQALSARKLDVVILQGSASVPENTHVTRVWLNPIPVMMKYSGLAVEPLSEEPVPQKVLWLDSDKKPLVLDFIACMKKGAGVWEAET